MTRSSAPGSRRRRMTRAQGKALIEEWKRSGLGRAAFAKARGVGVQRIDYWRRQLEGTGGSPFVVMSSDELIAEAEPVETHASDRDAIEISMGARVVVRVRHTPANLAWVLRELGAVGA